MSRMILYHGSESIIEHPRFGFGNPRNDYGLGFYCTEIEDLSREWAVTDVRDGWSNKYAVETDGLRILNLSDPEYNILNWITILVNNREFSLKNEIARRGKEFLTSCYSVDISEYDIIRGYRADDSYFTFASAFLNNTISCERLGEALRLGKLGEQIMIKSRRAFDRLEFLGYEKVLSSEYFPKRKMRDDIARKSFLSDREGTFRPDALYLIDIMRGGVAPDDPRIQ